MYMENNILYDSAWRRIVINDTLILTDSKHYAKTKPTEVTERSLNFVQGIKRC